MIITDDQRDYLGSRFEQLYDLYFYSALPFPYGLPGWKALRDMDVLCLKLLKLNRLSQLPSSRKSAQHQWENLVLHLSSNMEDADENLSYIVRAIPTIVAKMNAEHIYGA